MWFESLLVFFFFQIETVYIFLSAWNVTGCYKFIISGSLQSLHRLRAKVGISRVAALVFSLCLHRLAFGTVLSKRAPLFCIQSHFSVTHLKKEGTALLCRLRISSIVLKRRMINFCLVRPEECSWNHFCVAKALFLTVQNKVEEINFSFSFSFFFPQLHPQFYWH